MLDGDRGDGPAQLRAPSGVPADQCSAGEALYDASLNLRHRLNGHQSRLPDRSIAQQELSTLMVQAVAVTWGSAPGGGDEAEPATAEGLRHSLLLLAAALGSVSALAEPLDAVRQAVERAVASLDAPA